MPTKMMPGNRTIWWVPEAGLSSRDDVFKAATYATGGGSPKAINISCAIVTGYTLGSTDPDTDTSKSICDTANVQNPTQENYEGSLTFFREAIAEGQQAPGTTSVYDVAFNLFKLGLQGPAIQGYLVQRIGFPSEAEAVAGQLVSAFYFRAGTPQDSSADGEAPEQFTVPFLPQGWFKVNTPLT